MAGAYDGQRGAQTPSSTVASGARAAKPSEIPGAPSGNVRYRCMSLPTADGDDIEDVIVQMGLDGVKCFAGDDVTRTRQTFELPRIAKWSVVDSTILTIYAKDSSGERMFSLSADSGTISALVDVLTTSAFQWCELNGFDAMDTIVSSGSEWTNLKASSAVPGAISSSVQSIRFWESPEYSGWLTKQGEMLRTWRKRWFVLKEGYLVWFKTNVVNDRSVSRGTIPLDAIESVSAASEAAASRPFAIHLGGALPERIGAKFLVADSDRERAQWMEAIRNAMHSRSSSSHAAASSSAEQLRQGFAHVSTPPSAGRPRRVFPIRQTFKSKCRIMLLLARRVSHHNLRDPHTSRCRRYRSHTHPRLPGRRLSKLLRARPRASTTRPRTAHPTHRVTGRRITRRRANRTTTIESPASLRGMLPVDREPNE